MTENEIKKYVTINVDCYRSPHEYTVIVNGNRVVRGLNREQAKDAIAAIKHGVSAAVEQKMLELRTALGVE
jgi:hypothetical protein